MEISYVCKHFSELSAAELYEVLKLRVNVFVVEQTCPYPECDDKDQQAYHLMGYSANELMAYARILAPGVSYPTASIGRVVVKAEYRLYKKGYELMRLAINKTCQLYDINEITISAQHRLEKFYCNLGFKSKGGIYLEDDIPHIKMLFSG